LIDRVDAPPILKEFMSKPHNIMRKKGNLKIIKQGRLFVLQEYIKQTYVKVAEGTDFIQINSRFDEMLMT
jgi:hypothetical protein